jgi:calcineurin-like phosphoesterase family protein
MDSYNTFLSSDSHFFSESVIKNNDRPFHDADEMNTWMIKCWNNIVPKNATVYHLGDFSFGNRARSADLLSKLNGTIHLTKGNHDLNFNTDDGFESISLIKKVRIHHRGIRRRMILSHYPMMVWEGNHQGYVHCHGHCHGSLHTDNHSLRYDVGVDCWNYVPVSAAKIFDIADKQITYNEMAIGRKYIAYDHHKEKECTK